jgi:hypothetical protein
MSIEKFGIIARTFTKIIFSSFLSQTSFFFDNIQATPIRRQKISSIYHYDKSNNQENTFGNIYISNFLKQGIELWQRQDTMYYCHS